MSGEKKVGERSVFALLFGCLPRTFVGQILAFVAAIACIWMVVIPLSERQHLTLTSASSATRPEQLGITRKAADLPLKSGVGLATIAKVVRKADTVWSMQQGPLTFEIDLGEAMQVSGESAPVLNVGKDCWGKCQPGLCEWCGLGNACCKKGFGMDPPMCKTAKKFTSNHHECVAVSVVKYPHANVTLSLHGEAVLSNPLGGLFAVGRDLKDGWPATWDYGKIERIDVEGPWVLVEGSIATPKGHWLVKDQWRLYDGVVEGMRTWSWCGTQASSDVVLSIAWDTVQGRSPALLMPSVLYHGNPSGRQANGHAVVPAWKGKPGEKIQVEEHRLSQTWASLEWKSKGAGMPVVVALDSEPSAPPFAKHQDHAWSLGAEALIEAVSTRLQILSGPVALNGKTGVVKTGQNSVSSYTNVGLDVPPSVFVQKRYRLHAKGPVQQGAGFIAPLNWSLHHGHLSADSLPRVSDIVEAKVRFALSRWSAEKNKYAGFAMYPGNSAVYVMGWAGQAEAPGYALQVLANRLGNPGLRHISQVTLDVLSQAKFNENGFLLKLDGHSGEWSQQDPVSQGQAMSAFARAISFGRRTGADVSKWETFLERACKIHAKRMLGAHWYPRSTAEAFIIQPLAMATALFGNGEYLKAAIKGGDHYLQRHVGIKEPFWGGTLDAQCEDKEGAWAGFEAFLALHEATGDAKWLAAASYAADFVLTYTYLWDVDLPPGRLRDNNLKTRGWTSVSVQNMHLDVYGVLYTPKLWRLGELSRRPELFRLAELMFRTCGQMIDAEGSQGEQLQQTRFAQAGDLSNPEKFRGGYVESWTVFWIAAHFLTAAAQFEEMGVLGELWTRT